MPSRWIRSCCGNTKPTLCSGFRPESSIRSAFSIAADYRDSKWTSSSRALNECSALLHFTGPSNLRDMVVIEIRSVLVVSCLALVVTDCARTEPSAGSSILLFSGRGTSPNDVAAIEKVLRDRLSDAQQIAVRVGPRSARLVELFACRRNARRPWERL